MDKDRQNRDEDEDEGALTERLQLARTFSFSLSWEEMRVGQHTALENRGTDMSQGKEGSTLDNKDIDKDEALDNQDEGVVERQYLEELAR